MRDRIKALLLRLMRVPPEPAMPEGSARSLRVFRAAPAYYWYRLAGWLIGRVWLIVIAVVALTSVSRMAAQAPPALRTLLLVVEYGGFAALLGGTVLSWFLLRLDWEMRWYMVTDRSLRIREGVWQVHEMTMTFANIQNISISQGPLQRALGIADLRVQSAGGGGSAQPEGQGGQSAMRDLHVGWFRGVDDAAAIRDLVLERLRTLRDSGLGDEDDEHEHEHDEARGESPSRLAWSPGFVAALREAGLEARLLRQAAERSAPGPGAG